MLRSIIRSQGAGLTSYLRPTARTCGPASHSFALLLRNPHTTPRLVPSLPTSLTNPWLGYQTRSYLYLPTSWKELELRWLRPFSEKRTVYVQLLRDREVRAQTWYNDQAQQFRYRSAQRRARLSHQWDRVRRTYQFSRERWLSLAKSKALANTMTSTGTGTIHKIQNRSRKLRNRVVRKTRDSVDRVQRAWNRNLLWRAVRRRRRSAVTLTEYAHPSWFCSVTGRPKASRDATGRFVNPWLSQSTDGVKSIAQIAQWRWERTQRMWQEMSTSVQRYLSQGNNETRAISADQENLVTTAADSSSLVNPASTITAKTAAEIDFAVPYNQLKFTWIGHNTCLFQQGSVNILTDPIFSTRASPFQSLPVGVARDVPAAIAIEDLPEKLDVCIVSHDHYDHLDKDSVLALQSRVQLWVVPVGLSEWLQEKGGISADSVIELEWWESVKLVQTLGDDNNKTWRTVVRHSAIRDAPTALHPALSDPDVAVAAPDDHERSMWITCCPAQHWASRTFFDRNFRLWASFAVFLPGSKFFFGGDTALPTHFPLFEQIRDYIGCNVDLAALPIGAYGPAFFMQDAHMSPEEAVKVHQKLGQPRLSVGIHWGTFALSEEPMDEPPLRLRQAAAEAKVTNFTAIRHGDSVTVECVRQVDQLGLSHASTTEEMVCGGGVGIGMH